jgi:hypothetical protein
MVRYFEILNPFSLSAEAPLQYLMKQDHIFRPIATSPEPAYSGFHSPVCTAGGGESEDRPGGVRSHQDIRRQDQAPQGQSNNSNFLCFYFIFILPSVVDP